MVPLGFLGLFIHSEVWEHSQYDWEPHHHHAVIPGSMEMKEETKDCLPADQIINSIHSNY